MYSDIYLLCLYRKIETTGTIKKFGHFAECKSQSIGKVTIQGPHEILFAEC